MELTGKGKFSLQAPAKINLRLKVLGRRSDGYHELEMIMVRLSLFDEISVELRDEGITISSDSNEVPNDPSNSLWKAIDDLRSASGKNFGARIFLKKRIPTAAGMGGGSSDAAALLRCLNQDLHLGLSKEKLHQVAVRIGADVPFFLEDQPQLAEGIGERLTPIPGLPSFYALLMNPGFPVSTPQVYHWYDDIFHDFRHDFQGGDTSLTMEKLNANHPTLSGWLKEFPLENDLERVVLPRYPVLAEIKLRLSQAGALGTLMSGSGPTVFGLFETSASRDQGYDIILKNKDPQWWVCKAKSF